MAAASPRSLQELVTGPGFEGARRALSPFFVLRNRSSACRIPPDVAEKYGRSAELQSVITVTDRYLHRQTCWNPQRGQKPQNFKSAVVGAIGGSGKNGNGSNGAAAPCSSSPRPLLLHHALDPLLNGARASCDFCEPETSTAEDVPFGRYASPAPLLSSSSSSSSSDALLPPRAVSASNLFKCAAPGHGVVLLPGRHDPLAFSRADVAAALDCARGWFELTAAAASAAAEGEEGEDPVVRRRRCHHPFFLWNALPRAGASQYHAHAQTTLTDDPVPEQAKLWRAERAFAARRGRRRRRREDGGGAAEAAERGKESDEGGGGCYYSSLLRAKAAAGLLRVVTASPPPPPPPPSSSSSAPSSSSSALSSSSSAPSSSSSASSSLLLLDRRGGGGARENDGGPEEQQPEAAVAYVYAALAPVKDAELVIMVPSFPTNGGGGGGGGNLPALRSPALARALHAALRAAVDGVCGGSGAFNAAIHNIEVGGFGGQEDDDGEDEDEDEAPPPWPPAAAAESRRAGGDDGSSLFPSGRPLVARVVSRGPPTAAASDFGALEVMGGASIGHTDPYALLGLFDAALAAADGDEREGEEEEGEGRRQQQQREQEQEQAGAAAAAAL